MNQQKNTVVNNPYKELSPYLESDAYRFKGRTVEIEEMYESFDRNEYLVCHADSGEGKSSIIEAGLTPKMKANCYFPIRVVFKSNEHFKNINVDFDAVICGIIDEEIEKLNENKSIIVDTVYPNRLTTSDKQEHQEWERDLIEKNAWLKLRYSRITIDNLLYTPVLIFDQFEEVFTNPLTQEWTDLFFTWLQELSTDLCPQRIITEIEKNVGEHEFPEISTNKHFKAIFSLRSEYVGKLDYWGTQRHYIPLLKNNRYLLRPLTIKGAKEVITEQEGYDGLNDVADNIVDMLRKLQKGKNYVQSDKSELPCIPALLLSIVCSRAFNMSLEERPEFIRGLVANNDDEKGSAIYALISGFYEKAILECDIPSGDMAIIEDVLVNSEGNRQRVSSCADVLKTIDFSNKYLKKLEECRLIRVIPEYNREEDSVELVHDALCPIVSKRKEMRLEEETKEREEKTRREIAETKKREEQRVNATSFTLLSLVLIFFIWFISAVFLNPDTLRALIYGEITIDNLTLLKFSSFKFGVFGASLVNLLIIPILIYSSVKRLRITFGLSVYGIISNLLLMYLFIARQDSELSLRVSFAVLVLLVPAITLFYSIKEHLYGVPEKQEIWEIGKSKPLIYFSLFVSLFLFYLCVFNKTLGLAEPFNSSWAVFVIPLLTHEIIRGVFRQRHNTLVFIVLCCLWGLLTYNTSVIPFALPSYAVVCVLCMTMVAIIWSFGGLNWVKKIIAVVLDFIVLTTVVIMNIGFNIIKVKYDSVSHVYNWVDVQVHNQDNKVGIVSSCTGDTILPCAFDSIDHRQHYCYLKSNKISYKEDVTDKKGLYTYKVSTDTAIWQCLFIDEVENEISKYMSSTPDTLREDSIRVYAARVYHELRNANIQYLTSGKMYSLNNVKSLDTLVRLQNGEFTDILNEFSDFSSLTSSIPLDISQVVAFNKAFARSFYLCMLRDRIQKKDSVNLFSMVQEIVSLYFYDASNINISVHIEQPLTIGNYRKMNTYSFKVSDLRDNNLDSWRNYANMLLGYDISDNAIQYAKNKMDQFDIFKEKYGKLNDDIRRIQKENKSRFNSVSSKEGIDKINDLIDVMKKNDDAINSANKDLRNLTDHIEVEKFEMDMCFRKLINDVFMTVTNVIMNNTKTIYNSSFIDLCEQLYVLSIVRQYEMSPIYLQCLENMNNVKDEGFKLLREIEEQESQLKRLLGDI